MTGDDNHGAVRFTRWQPPGSRDDVAEPGPSNGLSGAPLDVPSNAPSSAQRSVKDTSIMDRAMMTGSAAGSGSGGDNHDSGDREGDSPGAVDPDATRTWNPNFDNTGSYDLSDQNERGSGGSADANDTGPIAAAAAGLGNPPPKADPAVHRPLRFEDADGFGDGTGGLDSAATTTIPPYLANSMLDPDLASDRASRRPPLVVWMITGAFAALMVMCTFLYPALSGPGEAQHTDLVYSFANGNKFYDPGDRFVSAGVEGAQQAAFPPRQPLANAAVLPRGQRQSLDALGGDVAGRVAITNTAVQNPPLYYLIGAGVLRIVPDSWPADRQIAILRYLSVLFLLPLPLLAWATARALVGNGPAATIAAAIPLALPGLVRIGGSVTNESLTILLGASLLFVLARVLAGDLRIGTGVVAGVLTGLACLTQGLALVLPVVVLVAYAVAWARNAKVQWLPLLLAGAFTAAISGWWWIRNVVLFRTIQPNGLGDQAAAVRGPARGDYTLATYAHDFFTVTGWRVLGGIGLPENPRFSLAFSWTVLALLGIGILLGIGFGIGGKLGRSSAVVLVLPLLLTLALVWVAGRKDFLFNGYLPHAQGRYLYPLVPALAAVAGIGFARALGVRASRWVPLVVVLGALATQAWAWRQLLHSWWTPQLSSSKDEVRDTVRAVLRWSPWAHPVTTATFIAVAALGTLAVLAAIGYGARRAFDEDDYPLPR